jgi:hypothetical protein
LLNSGFSCLVRFVDLVHRLLERFQAVVEFLLGCCTRVDLSSASFVLKYAVNTVHILCPSKLGSGGGSGAERDRGE